MPKSNAFMQPYCIMMTMFIAVLIMSIVYNTEAQADGSWSEQQGKLTLLADTPFYDEKTEDNKPAAVISAFQSVQVVTPSEGQLLSMNPSDKEWYLVKTWLGYKWIRNGPSVVKQEYHPVFFEVIFNEIEDLYNFPAEDQTTGGKLSPQKVTAIGQLFTCNKVQSDPAQAATDHCRMWYLIQTYLGDKWISPTEAAEHYESKDAVAAFTPSASILQNKLSSSIRDLEPILARGSLEPVSFHIENGIARFEVRKLYRHRDELNDQETEALKNEIFKELGGSFPLSITTYALADKADLRGNIVSIDAAGNRVLVVNYDKRTGLEISSPKASWIRLVADTSVHRTGHDSQLSLHDLKTGQTVEVWTAKFTLLTYPGQTTGYEIAIVDEAKPGEEGIPLGTILDVDLARIDTIELEFKVGKPLVIHDPSIIQAIAERMQRIRLLAADLYPLSDNQPYIMTLHQADKKAVYNAHLVLQQLPYSPNSLTADLDDYILKLR
ncbi:hypothetical protein DVH26_23210 [Paenibacillus sp. H1-7]|nr:hypothetical protein DVH26_23210 [Paenibacillus sp. H1-7]